MDNFTKKQKHYLQCTYQNKKNEMEKQQGKYVINREKGLANQVSTYSKQTTRNQVVDPSSRADRQKLYYSFFSYHFNIECG